MPIDYHTLKAREFRPITQHYTHRDTMLYALSLNLGANPLDPEQLRFVAHEPPAVLPTMAAILGRLGPWMRDPDVGIDYRRIVVGEVALRSFSHLSASGTIHSFHRVSRVTDKGAERGALVTVTREIRNDSGDVLSEFEQSTFCRAEGGFAADGRHDPSPDMPAWQFGDQVPIAQIEFATSPQQALIYRLTGDLNPLHSDPEVAKKAGFERPILHGLATLGIAGYVLSHFAGNGTTIDLKEISCRFSAPVFPGDVLQFQIWKSDQRLAFQARSLSSGKIVLDRGYAAF